MSCEPFREAVSAGLDGESPGVPQRWVDEHLTRCAACRSWTEAAAEVTRRARLTPASPVPDVTAAVLGRLPRRRVWLHGHGVDAALRLALLAVGAGQLAVGLPAFLGQGASHVAHETGAWNLGLAACFLVVATRPRLAAGALPFLLSFTAVLVAVTLADLGAGHVHADRAGIHLLLVGGAVLVSALAVRGRAPGRGPRGVLRAWAGRWSAGRAAVSTRAASAAPGVRRLPADPVAGHHAEPRAA
ncbi:zf-HC2 domain-containing protein [Modestobacter marinus]|uniref:zf-HC2 domain-containing protein n=1 Tax=Modestobacter marinus TaxID=477641 RepID=UPI001C941EF0|nr:zf-HC2 domain-containing protein [Modestobacter marinus]